MIIKRILNIMLLLKVLTPKSINSTYPQNKLKVPTAKSILSTEIDYKYLHRKCEVPLRKCEVPLRNLLKIPN